MSSSYSMEPHLWLLLQWVESKLLVSITFWLQPLLGKFSVKLILCHYLTEWPWRRIVTQVKKTCSLHHEVIILKVHGFLQRSRSIDRGQPKTRTLYGSQPSTTLKEDFPKIKIAAELSTIGSLRGFLILILKALCIFTNLCINGCSIQNITD